MKPRVLVVDDDAAVRYTLREILESDGMEVCEAGDGAQALERLDGDNMGGIRVGEQKRTRVVGGQRWIPRRFRIVPFSARQREVLGLLEM